MVDIERNNLRLCEDTAMDKEKIKSLTATVASLELQCEELQRCLDEVVLRRAESDKDRDSPVVAKISGDQTVTVLREDARCQVSCQVPNLKWLLSLCVGLLYNSMPY